MSEQPADTSWRKSGRCSSCAHFKTDFGEAPDLYGHCKMYSRSGSRTSADFACAEYQPMEGFEQLTRSADHDRHFTDPKLIREARKPEKTRPKTRRVAGSRRAAIAAENAAKTATERLAHWKTKMGSKTLDDAVPYNVRGRFEVDELIDHRKYGLGVVVKAIDAKKISVVFRDEERTLIHRHGE